MDKHERVHEEAGGPGFRSRSRSRSRGPVENRSETSVQSPATPVYRAANNNCKFPFYVFYLRLKIND